MQPTLRFGSGCLRSLSSTLPAALLGSLLLVSCDGTHSSAPRPEEPSVEQHGADLDRGIKTNTLRLSEAEAQRQQWDQDFEEIRSMGLVERAHRDFSARFTNATVQRWRIRYLMRTNIVWCDALYRLPGETELWQAEFGYTRKTGTNWSLKWRGEPPW